MSTDHPNGGSFLAYPQIIRLLMDRTYREDVLKTVPSRASASARSWPTSTREYTLNEIAIITRAGPARILGLKHKGHLGPGADADITIYTPHENKETMFELPRYVIKSGRILVEEGDIREEHYGKTLHVAPDYDPAAEAAHRRLVRAVLLHPLPQLPRRRRVFARRRASGMRALKGTSRDGSYPVGYSGHQCPTLPASCRRLSRAIPQAAEQLLPLVYDELRKLAAAKLAQEKPGQTLQATALVHEAYVRLVDGQEAQHWNSRGHFFGAAAEAMRRILVENARSKVASSEAVRSQRVNLEQAATLADQPLEDLLALDEALDKLRREDPVKAELGQARYFAGLTVQQAADLLGISRATADRYWAYAKVWLFAAVTGDRPGRVDLEEYFVVR